MKKWLMAVLLGSVLVLGACGSGDDAQDDTSVDEGTGTEEATDEGAAGGSVDASAAEELYKQNCASCHAQDLSGGVGPELTTIGSKMSAEEIEKIIVDGKGSMPPGLLTGDDAKLVAEWLAEKK